MSITPPRRLHHDAASADCYKVRLELDERAGVQAWIERVEARPGFVNALLPLPADAQVGHGRSIHG